MMTAAVVIGIECADVEKVGAYGVPRLFDRYVMRFQDAQALIRVALVDRHWSSAGERIPYSRGESQRSDAHGQHTPRR